MEKLKLEITEDVLNYLIAVVHDQEVRGEIAAINMLTVLKILNSFKPVSEEKEGEEVLTRSGEVKTSENAK